MQHPKRFKTFYLLLVIVYGTMILFGLVENLKGTTFPLIKDAFHASYDAQGSLVSFSSFGYVFFCMVATLSFQKYGIKKSLIFGYLMIVLGCIATVLAPTFGIISLTLAILWMGFGFFEVGTNALATTIFKNNSAIYMNLLHFFYGLGAVLGPIFASSITTYLHTSFRGIYLIVLIPLLIFLGIILFTKFDASEHTSEEVTTMTIRSGLRNKHIWLFSLALGFLEVIEFGAANWGAFFLRDAYGLDPLTVGASFVSGFYICFTLSRLFSGFAIEKMGYIKSMITGLVILFILFISGFALGKQGIILLVGTGFFIAIMWPTIMCVAMDVFKADAPIATSIIIVISGSINAIMQLITGLINEHILDTLGYTLNLVYIFIPLSVMIYFYKHQHHTKS